VIRRCSRSRDSEILRESAQARVASSDALVEKDAYGAGTATACPWDGFSFITALTLIGQGATGTIFHHCSQGTNYTHCQKANDSWATTAATYNGYGKGLGACNVSGAESDMQLILTFRDLNGWHDQLFGWIDLPSGFWVTWAHKGLTWKNNPEYYRVYHDAVRTDDERGGLQRVLTCARISAGENRGRSDESYRSCGRRRCYECCD
jgi:hypothetical protein